MEHKSVDFTDEQYQAIEWTERVCSLLSLFGSFFVVASFLLSGHFKAPINRLIFYASLGNILTNVATLVSRSGIKMAEKKGELTALCQFQGLFIQWSVAFCPPPHGYSTSGLSRSPNGQVYASRCSLDILHGLQCLLDFLS